MIAIAEPQRSLYDVERANRVLPLVRSIVTDIISEFVALRTVGRRIREIEVAAAAEDERELEECRNTVSKLSALLEGYIQEVNDLGVEIRDLELGLVDFPALVSGEPAFLSWRCGEDDVGWWHPADKGFTDRMPIPEALTP